MRFFVFLAPAHYTYIYDTQTYIITRSGRLRNRNTSNVHQSRKITSGYIHRFVYAFIRVLLCRISTLWLYIAPGQNYHLEHTPYFPYRACRCMLANISTSFTVNRPAHYKRYFTYFWPLYTPVSIFWKVIRQKLSRVSVPKTLCVLL